MSAEATFWAWQQDVPTTHHRCILLCLANCHNGDNGQCNPSMAYIMRMTKSSKATVIKAIRELNCCGLISIRKTGGESNQYTLHLHKLQPLQMHHTVYRVTDQETGEYYIGIHSTYDLNDNYLGSGRWVFHHRNKPALSKEVLFNFPTQEAAAEKELEMIKAVTADPLCMNIGTTKQVNNTQKGTTKPSTTKPSTTKSGTTEYGPSGSTKSDTQVVLNLGHESKRNLKGNLKVGKFDPRKLKFPVLLNAETWLEWCDSRSSRRKPITERAAHQQIAMLVEHPPDVQRAIVQQSIANDYQGLFRLKGGSNANHQPTDRPRSVVDRIRAGNDARSREREKTLSGPWPDADDPGIALGANG